MRFALLLLSSLSASALVSASITSSASTIASTTTSPETDAVPHLDQSIQAQAVKEEKTLGERSHEKKSSHRKKHKSHKGHNHKAVSKQSQRKSGARATYYSGNQLNNPACGGATPGDQDMVGAVVKGGGYGDCGDRVTISSGGKEVTITIVDYCEGCPSPGGFDLTKGAFKKLAPLSQGVIEDFKYWES